MTEILKIDGGYGEGGGQIIRTAISLSSITHKPIQITDIRRNRRNSGLSAQHLTAIRVIKKICNAKVEGLHIGSSTLEFIPGDIQSADLCEDIGTAGSISLILQTVIVPVAVANKRLRLSIIGGTDVPWSPTIDYTKYVLSTAYSRMGINFFIRINRRGYYPRGMGKVFLDVHPSKRINGISLLSSFSKENGGGNIANLFCSFSKYPFDSINMEIEKIRDACKKNQIKINSFVKKDIGKQEAIDGGGSIFIYLQTPSSIVGVDDLLYTKKNFSSNYLIEKFLNNYAFGTDDNLADMLVVPASLVRDVSVYSVRNVTEHLRTNLYVASKITGCKYNIEKINDGYEVRIKGYSDSGI